MEYLEVPLSRAYGLMNCGGLVWICTKSPSGRYDLAPIAWACPLDLEPASRVLFVCDPAHASYGNLMASGEFAVAFPSVAQRELALLTGSVSGRDEDKYARFGIGSFGAQKVDVLVPSGSAGWIECRLLRSVLEGSVAVVFGEALAAKAVRDAWKLRLHFVSEEVSYAPGEAL
jgi:flavin reductase (DIM6/NTAB) family NADH-FMN oxidoreductase RutF